MLDILKFIKFHHHHHHSLTLTILDGLPPLGQHVRPQLRRPRGDEVLQVEVGRHPLPADLLPAVGAVVLPGLALLLPLVQAVLAEDVAAGHGGRLRTGNKPLHIKATTKKMPPLSLTDMNISLQIEQLSSSLNLVLSFSMTFFPSGVSEEEDLVFFFGEEEDGQGSFEDPPPAQGSFSSSSVGCSFAAELDSPGFSSGPPPSPVPDGPGFSSSSLSGSSVFCRFADGSAAPSTSSSSSSSFFFSSPSFSSLSSVGDSSSSTSTHLRRPPWTLTGMVLLSLR